MFCTKCGKDNGDSNKFCIECGEPLNGHVEEPAVNKLSPEETVDVYSAFVSDSEKLKGNDDATTILGDQTKVRLISGEDLILELSSFPSIIGKGSKADVIVSGDDSVSRQHFCIHEHNQGNYIIEDMGSTNKTYLNDNVLEKNELVVLNDNDKIKAGRTIFTVEIV